MCCNPFQAEGTRKLVTANCLCCASEPPVDTSIHSYSERQVFAFSICTSCMWELLQKNKPTPHVQYHNIGVNCFGLSTYMTLPSFMNSVLSSLCSILSGISARWVVPPQRPLHGVQALGLAEASQVGPTMLTVNALDYGNHAFAVGIAPLRVPHRVVASGDPVQFLESVLQIFEKVGNGPCGCALAPRKLLLARRFIALVVLV